MVPQQENDLRAYSIEVINLQAEKKKKRTLI
jgi:hypothetical protein